MTARVLLALIVTGALVFGWVLTPSSVPETDPDVPEPLTPPIAVCPVTVDRTSASEIRAGATTIGEFRFTVSQAGAVVEDTTVRSGAGGGLDFPAQDLGIGGDAGVLVEADAEVWAASSVSVGPAGIAVAGCTPAGRSSTMLVGGSTRNEESLELVLVNPYGADAIVEVTSSSEAGVDSADELEAVVVPARSTVIRDIAGLLPLRSRLSVTVTPTRGVAHAFLTGGGGDRIAIESADPTGSWVVPVPSVEGNVTSVVIATTSPVDVAVQVEGRIGDEVLGGLFTGVIGARSQIELVFDGETDPIPALVDVVADGPVSVSVVSEGEAGRGIAVAVPEPFFEWLVPGAGAPGGVAWIAVPGDADATVEFQSLTEGGATFSTTVPSGATTGVVLRDDPTGWYVSSDTPVAIVWSVADDTGLGLGTGTGLPGGV